MTIPVKHYSAYLIDSSLFGVRSPKDCTAATQFDAFAASLNEAVTAGEKKNFVLPENFPLPKEDIQKIIWQLQEQINSQLFRLVTEDKDDNDFPIPYLWEMPMPIMRSDSEESASKKPRLSQNNDAVFPMSDMEVTIEKAARAFGVDADLIRSMIKVESNFAAGSTSPKGAMGLMQLMPATAREMGVNNPYNPEESIIGGTRYFKSLLDRYHGNASLALAAYNWGMGNLEKNPDKMPRETKDYISRVWRHYRETKV
jgi:hypothetical protein